MLFTVRAGSAMKDMNLYKSVPWWEVKGKVVEAKYRIYQGEQFFLDNISLFYYCSRLKFETMSYKVTRCVE